MKLKTAFKYPNQKKSGLEECLLIEYATSTCNKTESKKPMRPLILA